MGPDYDLASFWDKKFKNNQDIGEWLNAGEPLRDAVLSDLDRREGTGNPRVLHLGPGISKLGSKLCDAFADRGWMGRGIMNVDFSIEAVRLGQETEKDKDPAHTMPWVQADLRSWADLSNLVPFGPFDVIMDKSTCDAIATSKHETFSPHSSSDSNVCPTVLESIDHDEATTLAPIELLGLHLVPLTKRDSTWIALSYSSVRFNVPLLEQHWEVVEKTAVQAPSGILTSTVSHAPRIYHWLYVLKRK